MSSTAQNRATNFLNAELGAGSFVPRTGAVVLQLDTVIGSQAAAGTPVSGGGYVNTACPFGTATVQTGAYSAQIVNSGTVTFTNMPATTVVAIELLDSAGSPIRLQWGGVTTNKAFTAGDSAIISAGAISVLI